MSITSALVAKQTSIKKKKKPLCKRWLHLSKKQNLNPNGMDLWISRPLLQTANDTTAHLSKQGIWIAQKD